ncbi:MAG: efflux RND transporter periplasmic adaptor subunit [Deltaproteobacteria bacterium]|jgi:Cu(I)/Ag(I) efflux system membrane fusion protein|nr:efflux RND transporter periplasmic adaptor subunit [Deltaproteobacteria bacterium]
MTKDQGKPVLRALPLWLGLALGAAAAVWAASAQAQPPPEEGSSGAAGGERQVLYWYDPMYPSVKFDAPGRSPFMDMALVPRYQEQGDGAGVRIDPAQVQNLGLRTARVKKGRLSFARDLPANVAFNGYQQARIQARAGGFVAAAGGLAPGDRVVAGQILGVVTVPGWASDQSEYLLLKSQKAAGRIIDGVREKLRLGGMPEEMLAEVDRTGRVQTDLKIVTPLDGVLTELDLYPGMNVEPNMTLAVVQGFDPIWVEAEVPERELRLADGRVRVTVAAWPEQVFEVLSSKLLPKANEETRTVPLRLEVANPEGRLKPGLTATVRLRAQGPEALLIPTQSLIDLGDEKRVIVRAPDGTFVPKAVVVSGSAREETAVSAGLDEDDLVVVSGLFLIDSEANLAGALDRLTAKSQNETAGETAARGGAPAPASASGSADDAAGHGGHGGPGVPDKPVAPDGSDGQTAKGDNHDG